MPTIPITVDQRGSFTAPHPLAWICKGESVNWESTQGFPFIVKFKGMQSPFQDLYVIQDSTPRTAVNIGQYYYSVAVFDTVHQKLWMLAGSPELDVGTA